MMEIKTEKMSQPEKVVATIDADDLKERKEKAYNSIKGSLELKGFRKGGIPRAIAEKNFSSQQLYKTLLDDIYFEMLDEKKDIVATRGFTLFGDLSDGKSIKVEFIAELEPEVTLPELDDLEIKYEKKVEVTDEEIKEFLKTAQKENEILEDVEGRDDAQNMDSVIMDFEGILEGESEPFKGGTAKNYSLTIDINNKTFVDDFEEQMMGMRKGEIRSIDVTFPKDYRDKTKANKKVTFKVTLHEIKRKILPELDNEFAKKKGFNTLKEYKKDVIQHLTETKKEMNLNDLKKNILQRFLEKSEFTPIPIDIINQDLNNEWISFLL